MQKQREYYTSCVSTWKSRCEELEASCSKYRTSLDDAERKVRDLQSQLDQEQCKRLDTEQQLDVGRRELQEAHTYLETSDRMSGEDVMGLVSALNSEIFQFAAAIAETRSRREDVLVDKPSLDDLEKFVGASLVDILRRESVPGADPEFLLQTALQVALAKVAHRWTKLFSVSDNSQAEVRAAFDSIRTTSACFLCLLERDTDGRSSSRSAKCVSPLALPHLCATQIWRHRPGSYEAVCPLEGRGGDGHRRAWVHAIRRNRGRHLCHH